MLIYFNLTDTVILPCQNNAEREIHPRLHVHIHHPFQIQQRNMAGLLAPTKKHVYKMIKIEIEFLSL